MLCAGHLTVSSHRRHWGGTNKRLPFVGRDCLRNTRDVLNLVHELRQKGAVLNVLEPKFATTDVAGPILVTVLGMVAELERSFIRERQKAGIERAKANGVYKGRKPTVPVEQVRAMHKDGVGPSAIARELGISRMSVHRALNAG